MGSAPPELARRVREIEKSAEEYATYYVEECPVQSVRVMQPSGAIFVILGDGREVLLPQLGPVKRKRGGTVR